MRTVLKARIPRLMHGLQQPIDIGSLVMFRIGFGLIMVWEACRYLGYGWALFSYHPQNLHFPYEWFPWVVPLPGIGMVGVFVFIALMGFLIALGLFYRMAIVLFTIALTYTFLIDKANYLNHIYLICLLGLLMCGIPAHRACSLDVKRQSHLASDTVPAWSLWLLRLQLSLVYVFGGVAKVKYDWLIAAEPMQTWLAEHAHAPWIGGLFLQPPVVLLFAWGGMLLDLLVVPALLWRQTRPIAVLVLCGFHLANAYLFKIGIFPWLMIAATTLFLDPDWPHRFRRLWPQVEKRKLPPSLKPPQTWRQYVGLSACCAYVAVQLFLPIRHYFIPGDVNWTQEGARFAWRMKLNRRSGYLKMYFTSEQEPDRVEVPLERFVTKQQFGQMFVYPDMIHDLALVIKHFLTAQGDQDVKIFVEYVLSLNGRPSQDLIVRDADVASFPKGGFLSHQPYLIPLKER